MPDCSYDPIFTEYFHSDANFLMRLNRKDTELLEAKLKEADAKETGVNLIFMRVRPAISLTYSDARQQQVKLIAFTDGMSVGLTNAMRGYNGKWSHWEIVVSDKQKALEALANFLGRAALEGSK